MPWEKSSKLEYSAEDTSLSSRGMWQVGPTANEDIFKADKNYVNELYCLYAKGTCG